LEVEDEVWVELRRVHARGRARSPYPHRTRTASTRTTGARTPMRTSGTRADADGTRRETPWGARQAMSSLEPWSIRWVGVEPARAPNAAPLSAGLTLAPVRCRDPLDWRFGKASLPRIEFIAEALDQDPIELRTPGAHPAATTA
jgi:hypothetical protein